MHASATPPRKIPLLPIIVGFILLAISALTRLGLALYAGVELAPLGLWPGIFAKGLWFDLTIATVLAIDVILIAVNHWLVPLLFGRPFAPSAMVADLLLVGLVPYAAKLMFAAALKAADRALAIPRAEIAGLIVIAPALFVLVPAYGLFGAAAATVLAQAASAVVLGARLGRELELRPLRLMVPTRDDVALLRGYLDRALNRA